MLCHVISYYIVAPCFGLPGSTALLHEGRVFRAPRPSETRRPHRAALHLTLASLPYHSTLLLLLLLVCYYYYYCYYYHYYLLLLLLIILRRHGAPALFPASKHWILSRWLSGQAAPSGPSWRNALSVPCEVARRGFSMHNQACAHLRRPYGEPHVLRRSSSHR